MEGALSPASPGLRLQHLQNAVQLAPDVVALGGALHHLVRSLGCITSGFRLRRLCGGFGVQRSGDRTHIAGQLLQLLRCSVICRQAEEPVERLFGLFFHSFQSFLRLSGGVVFYCNTVARPASRHNRHVIAHQVCLPVSVQVWFKPAIIAAGDLPQHAAFHVGSQSGVLDNQVGHGVVPIPAHMLQVPLGVGSLVLRSQHLRRVPPGDVLSLQAGQRRRREHVLLQAVDGHWPLRFSFQPQFSRRIHLRAGPVDRHIVADQVSLRRLDQVLRDMGAIVRNRHQSTPGTIAA